MRHTLHLETWFSFYSSSNSFYPPIAWTHHICAQDWACSGWGRCFCDQRIIVPFCPYSTSAMFYDYNQGSLTGVRGIIWGNVSTHETAICQSWLLFLGFEILNIHLIISATADLIKFLSDIVCINKSKQGKGKGWQNMVNRFLRTIHVLVIMEYSPEDQCHNLIQTVVTT